MIEGLRVFPAYQDARRRKAVVSDCVTCKREQTMTTRQAIGCGYEPALADAQAWAPPSWADSPGMTLTTCPGYTTTMPAVLEVVDAFPHFKAHTLTDYLDGAAPNPVALGCLAVLDAGVEEFKADCAREAMKKPGAA